jgi:methyl coenzyme M reductase gamma subunit
MTAKELIKAATALRDCGDATSNEMEGLAATILATVREDDDERVTREKMYTEEGWGFDPLFQEWKRINLGGVSVSFEEDGVFLRIQSRYTTLKTMGHLRRLVAALGE